MNTNPRLQSGQGGFSLTTRALLRRGPRALVLVLMLLPCLGCKHESSVSYGPTNDAEEAFARPDRPANAKTLFAFARLLLSQGKTAEGEYVLQQLLRTTPQFRPAYLKLGELQMQSGRVDAAVATLSSGLAIAPEDPALLNDLGMCWMLKERHDLALSLFDQASARGGDDRRYVLNGAIALGMMGRYQESLDRFARVLSEKDAHRNVGVICVARGDYDAASSFMQSAWQNRPDSPESAAPSPATAQPALAPSVPEAANDEVKVAEPKSRKVGSMEANEATAFANASSETPPMAEAAIAVPTSAPTETAEPAAPAPAPVEPVPAAAVVRSSADGSTSLPAPSAEAIIPVAADEPCLDFVGPPVQEPPFIDELPAGGAVPPAIQADPATGIPVSARSENPRRRAMGWAFSDMQAPDHITAVEVSDPMPRSIRATSAVHSDRRFSGRQAPARADKGGRRARPKPARVERPRQAESGVRAEAGSTEAGPAALSPNEVHQVAILRGHDQKTVVFHGGAREETVTAPETTSEVFDDATSGHRVIRLRMGTQVDTLIFDTEGRLLHGPSHIGSWVAE